MARFPPNGFVPILGRSHFSRSGPFFLRLFVTGGRVYGADMLYFAIKAALSGLIAAAVSEIARRYPGWGGLVASLPLTSLMALIWTWRDTGDVTKVAGLASGAMWFILPSLPLFLIIPALLRAGTGFWAALGIGCAITLALYAVFFWMAPRVGIAL